MFQEYTCHFLRKRSGVGVEDEGLQGDGEGELTTAILILPIGGLFGSGPRHKQAKRYVCNRTVTTS